MSKNKFLRPRSQFLACGAMIGFGLLLCASAGAQNLLKNGDFEQPLGATNWTIGYLHGGPDDYDVKDRTRYGASGGGGNFYGGSFRPVGSIRLAHAYFSQTVTNLDTNHLYTVSGKMREDWWRGAQDPNPYNPGDATGEGGDGKRTKFLVYIEAIGGLGAPSPDDRASRCATNPAPVYPGYPDLEIYATGSWATYSTQQKPDANGTIEVRLHHNKVNQVTYDKCWQMFGMFDNISVTP